MGLVLTSQVPSYVFVEYIQAVFRLAALRVFQGRHVVVLRAAKVCAVVKKQFHDIPVSEFYRLQERRREL